MTLAPSKHGTLALAPGDRFFVQSVPLDPSAPAGPQVALAVEAASPFPLAQLYHGFVLNAARSRALAFAAYRRRFGAEEQAGWPDAMAVLPTFVGLTVPMGGKPGIVIHVGGGTVHALAWDGKDSLPALVISRAAAEPTESEIAALVAEVRQLSGLASAEARRLKGPITAEFTDKEEAVMRVDGVETVRLGPGAVVDADIRDKSFLQERLVTQQQGRRWWGAATLAFALLGLALLFEVAGLSIGIWNRQARGVLGQHADDARRIEAAQTMAVRIEQLSERQQRPLEWLALASGARPRSVQFIRATGRNDRTLEVEAQTPNANDVGNYEAALRQSPAVERVQVRDLRAREGMTSFVVALTFKPSVPLAPAPAPDGGTRP